MTIGVYLLKKAGEVVYVGQTVNVKKRLGEHRRRGVDFDSFEVIETPMEALKRTESEYILKHRPPLNGRESKYGGRVFYASTGGTQSWAERKRGQRARMKAAGYRQYQVWVNPGDEPTVKRIVRWVQYKLSKEPGYEPRLKDTSARSSGL